MNPGSAPGPKRIESGAPNVTSHGYSWHEPFEIRAALLLSTSWVTHVPFESREYCSLIPERSTRLLLLW